jgi:hypothetical protein
MYLHLDSCSQVFVVAPSTPGSRELQWNSRSKLSPKLPNYATSVSSGTYMSPLSATNDRVIYPKVYMSCWQIARVRKLSVLHARSLNRSPASMGE